MYACRSIPIFNRVVYNRGGRKYFMIIRYFMTIVWLFNATCGMRIDMQFIVYITDSIDHPNFEQQKVYDRAKIYVFKYMYYVYYISDNRNTKCEVITWVSSLFSVNSAQISYKIMNNNIAIEHRIYS